MRISGFSMIRNAVLMGYPILESIQSVLPIVDEFVIGVGQSTDGTKELVESLKSPKIKIFDSHWDETKTSGGLILSEKTNEALARCQNDWCLYLQADEVLHEQDLAPLVRSMEKFENDSSVHGLLFKYIHFYGSYDRIATSRRWYRNEIRAVKRTTGIQSVGDAQGFRLNGEKAKVRESGARVFHYGWVKPPHLMGQKKKLLDRWWHGSKFDHEAESFRFSPQYGLKKFTGSHPAVMKKRVEQQNWKFEPVRTFSDWTLSDLNLWASDMVEKIIGYRIGEYKNYRLIRKG